MPTEAKPQTMGEIMAERFVATRTGQPTFKASQFEDRMQIDCAELAMLLQGAYETGQRARPSGTTGDAIDRAAEALTESMRLVAEAARDVADSADSTGRATTADDDALKDLKEAITGWSAASEAALKAIHESVNARAGART